MTREQEIMEGALAHDYDLAFAEVFAEGARWADSHPHWISVEDELPKDSERVLCVTATGWVYVDFYSRTTYGNIWFQTERNPTHWMPLPKFPKK